MLLQSFRDQLRTRLGVDDVDLVDGQADLLINMPYWFLLAELDIEENKKNVTFPTVAGERAYELPTSLEAIIQIAITNPDSGEHAPLNPMSRNTYESVYVEGIDQQDIPTHYFRDGFCNIKMFPTPDRAYTILLRHREILSDLSNTSTDPRLPRQFDPVLLSGAVAEGHKHFRDYRAFQQEYAYFVLQTNKLKETLVKSKEKEDYTNAGLQPYIPTYP